MSLSSAASTRDPVPVEARYECLLKIASGGMATVYVGRLRGVRGFSRLVAIKRAHAHLVDDEVFRKGLVTEARLASRIHHGNVVSVLDVDELRDELLLVMQYVEGASVSELVIAARKAGERLSAGVVVRIALDACAGLHAAHELLGDLGEPLEIVHRDVSPQNILVGLDGTARLTDFGIAKHQGSVTHTTTGLKGKLGYMAPEYVRDRKVDRRADVFAMGVVVWEAFTGEKLFRGDTEIETIQKILDLDPPPMRSVAPEIAEAFEAPVARALSRDPAARFATASDFAAALQAAAREAGVETSAEAITKTVERWAGEPLSRRRRVLADIVAQEASGSTSDSLARASTVVESPPDGTLPGPDAQRMSISDARTLEMPRAARAVEPAEGGTEAARPASVLPAQARRSPRWAALGIIVATASIVVVTGLSLRSRSAPPSSAPAAVAAVAEPLPSATDGAAPGAPDAPTPTSDVALPTPLPRTAPPHPGQNRRHVSSRERPTEEVSQTGSPAVASPPPTTTLTGAPSAHRPGLGY